MSDRTSRTLTSFDLSCLSAKSYSVHEWDLVVARFENIENTKFVKARKTFFRLNLYSSTGSWSVKTTDLIFGVIYNATTFVILSKSIGWITNCQLTENSILDTSNAMDIFRMRRKEWYRADFIICILMSLEPIDKLFRNRENTIEFISSPD